MSVAILAFDLSEESVQHECAVRGLQMYETIDQVRQLIRSRRKHGSGTAKELQILVDDINEILWEVGEI